MAKRKKAARRPAPRKKAKAKNPGTGAFKRCVKKASKKPGVKSPGGVCRAAGLKKYGAKKFQAMAAAGRKRASSKRKAKRKNPEESAADRYEYFHGRRPDKVIEVTEKLHEHSVLSGIGKLVALVILSVDGQHEVVLKGFGGSVLAQDERGRQLFIKGGNQTVDLADFGIHRPHELEVLGAALEVVYDTQKDHLRPEDGGKANYHHKFGGGRSRLPIVLYDVRNKLLQFAGGGYTLPEVGIRG